MLGFKVLSTTLEELSSPVVQPHIHPPEHDQGTYSGRHLHLLENIVIVRNRRHLEQSICHSHRQRLKEDFIIHLSAIGLLQRYHFFKILFCQLSIVFNFNGYAKVWRDSKEYYITITEVKVGSGDIVRGAKRRGKSPPLATEIEVNNCFSIY